MMKKKILAINAMMLLLIATMPVFAEESDIYKNRVYAAGFGAAIDDEDNMHRSKMVFVLTVRSNDTDKEYDVKRGILTINLKHERDNYIAIADTWTVRVGENNTNFYANGKMLDARDVEHDVVLEGELLADTNQGLLYIAKGTLDDKYTMHYLLKVTDLDIKRR